MDPRQSTFDYPSEEVNTNTGEVTSNGGDGAEETPM